MQSRLTRALRYPVLASTLAAACCAAPPPAPAPPPPPVASPAPTPAPPPPPVVQEAVYANFLDAPRSQGSWEYVAERNETFAIFSTSDEPVFWIACQLAAREIGFVRPNRITVPTAMRIRAETTDRLLTARPLGSRGLLVTLETSDPLLDAMALSRGRFAVETEGLRTLYLPAWAEVSRVIEDCR